MSDPYGYDGSSVNPARPHPEQVGPTAREKWDRANELEVFLSDKEHVFNLLFDQQISPKKAIEALCCYKAGNIPALPAQPSESPAGEHARLHFSLLFFGNTSTEWQAIMKRAYELQSNEMDREAAAHSGKEGR